MTAQAIKTESDIAAYDDALTKQLMEAIDGTADPEAAQKVIQEILDHEFSEYGKTIISNIAVLRSKLNRLTEIVTPFWEEANLWKSNQNKEAPVFSYRGSSGELVNTRFTVGDMHELIDFMENDL